MRDIAKRQGDSGDQDRFHTANAPLSAFERQPYLSGAVVLSYGDRMDHANPDRKQHDALKDLERLHREGDLITGLLRQTTAAEADRADPIERWGRRIGRALAAVAFLAFCVYLYLAYVR